MKTLSETSPENLLPKIEKYLFGHMDAEERLLFEAQMLLHPELAEQVEWQQHTYDLVRQYGRKQLRAELERVHQTLFSQSRYQYFRQKILRLFSH